MDILGRSKQLQDKLVSRFDEFYELFRDEDASQVNSAFKVSVTEVVSEEQWKDILMKTAHLVAQVNSKKT